MRYALILTMLVLVGCGGGGYDCPINLPDGGDSTPPDAAQTTFTLALSTSTPLAQTVLLSAKSVPMLKFVGQASKEKDAPISSFSFILTGVGSNDDVQDVDLWSDNGVSVGSATFDQKSSTYHFENVHFTVPAGTKYAWTLFTSFQAKQSGGQYAIELKDVVLEDGGGVKGLPVHGNAFTVVDVPSVSLKAEDITSIGATMVIDINGPNGFCSFDEHWTDMEAEGWSRVGPLFRCGSKTRYRLEEQFMENSMNNLRVAYDNGNQAGTAETTFTTPGHEINLEVVSVDANGNLVLRWDASKYYLNASTACGLLSETNEQSEEFDQFGLTTATVKFSGFFPGQAYLCKTRGLVSVDYNTGERILEGSPYLTVQIPTE